LNLKTDAEASSDKYIKSATQKVSHEIVYTLLLCAGVIEN